jgi:hypothetical protein
VSDRQGALWLNEEALGLRSGWSGLSAAIAMVVGALFLFGASPAGATVFSLDRDPAYETGVPPGIGLATPTGDGHTRLGPARKVGRPSDPAWSPNGASLAFSATRAANTDSYSGARDGSDARRLSLDPVPDSGARVSSCPSFSRPPPPTPTPESTARATPTCGKVLVLVPGTRTFVRLTSPREIPVGTRVDTRHGVVTLTTAFPGHRNTTTTASRGVFDLTQTAPTTDLTLSQPRCPSARASSIRRLPPPDSLMVTVRSKRHLRAHVIGQHSIGASFGTTWTTTNGCSHTVTRLAEGTLTVHDLVAKRSVVIHRSIRNCGYVNNSLYCLASSEGPEAHPAHEVRYIA